MEGLYRPRICSTKKSGGGGRGEHLSGIRGAGRGDDGIPQGLQAAAGGRSSGCGRLPRILPAVLLTLWHGVGCVVKVVWDNRNMVGYLPSKTTAAPEKQHCL